MAHEFSEYKGNPMIVLDPEGKWPFRFGKGKARLILENIDAIRKFADEEVVPQDQGGVAAPDMSQGEIPF